MAVDDDAGAGGLDALAVEGVGHDFGRAEEAVEGAALAEGDLVTEGELFIKGSVGGHAVVVAAGQVADFGMQRPAERDVDLLKAAADAEEGLATLHAGAHERQHHRVTAAVEGAVGGRLVLAVFLGVDVRAPAGEQEGVAGRDQFGDRDEGRIGGDDERQPEGDLGHRGRVHRAAGMGRILVVDEVAVADDADDGTGHADGPLICARG